MDLSTSGIDFANLFETEQKEQQEAPGNYSRQMSRQISRHHSRQSSIHSETGSLDENEPVGVQLESTSKGKVKGSVSMSYYLAGANWFSLSILLVLFIVVQILASVADIWVSIW